MTKLNQLLAIEQGARTAAISALKRAYQDLQKPSLLSGLSRKYEPLDDADEGEQLPPERTLVQLTVPKALASVRQPLSRLFDVTFERDGTNTQARADVKVGDDVILADVPVTYLLWLEKQLQDLHTLVSKLPRLDPSEEWEWDDTTGTYRTPETSTRRTKKVKRNHILYHATDKHPAQVQAYDEDVPEGFWKTVKFSGAIPATEAEAMLRRVRQLQDAVKQAREQANMTDVQDGRGTGDLILSYVFGQD